MLASEIFVVFHLDIKAGLVPGVAVFVALVLLAGIAQYMYAQVALIEIPFAGLLKNCLLYTSHRPGVAWPGQCWCRGRFQCGFCTACSG